VLVVIEQVKPRKQDGDQGRQDAAAHAEQSGADGDGDQVKDRVRPVDIGDIQDGKLAPGTDRQQQGSQQARRECFEQWSLIVFKHASFPRATKRRQPSDVLSAVRYTQEDAPANA